MIGKTKDIQKAVFYPLTGVSFIFTVVLFWDFGANVFTSVLWAIVGIGLEFLKLFFLTKWRNEKMLKKKKLGTNFTAYLSLAFLSAFASLVFGIGTIERQTQKASYASAYSDEIKIRISDAEKRLEEQTKDTSQGQQRQAIQRRIDALTAQIGNITEGVSERSIQLSREIDRLQAQMQSVDLGDAQKKRDETIKLITSLKSDYAHKAIDDNGVKNSFEIISRSFHVPQNLVMIMFLFFVVLAVEIGMATTSGAIDKVEKKKKVAIRKDHGQIEFGEQAIGFLAKRGKK